MPTLLLTVLVWFATTAVGHCLTPFAGVPDDDADREVLVQRTYAELLDRVGGAKLGRPEITAMVEGGDPFLVAGDADLTVLQKSLHELKRMLEQQGWNTLATRANLLNQLRHGLDGMAALAAREPLLLTRNLPSYHLRLGQGGDFLYSPDGQWVISLDRDHYRILNTSTREIATHAKMSGQLSLPFFSSDGRHLIFPVAGNAHKYVPFENGRLLYDRAGEKIKADGAGKYAFFVSASANKFISPGPVRESGALGYDFRTGATVPVPLPAELQGKTLWYNGFFPGKSRGYFVASHGAAGSRVHLVSYDSTSGTFRMKNSVHVADHPIEEIHLSADGKTLVTGSGPKASVWVSPVAGGAFTAFRNRAGETHFGNNVIAVRPLPKRNEVLIVSEQTDTESAIDVVDLATGQSRKSVTVPYVVRANVFVAPDGLFLYFPNNRDGGLSVYNLSALDP